MNKGKFGFAVWLYPYLALWAFFLDMDLIPFLIAGLVLVVEKDEWATKQCLHTIMIGIYYNLYQWIMAFLISIPFTGFAFIVFDLVVDVVFFVMVFILGFIRLKKGKSIQMFGMGTINRAYGYIKPKETYQNGESAMSPHYPAPPPYQPFYSHDFSANTVPSTPYVPPNFSQTNQQPSQQTSYMSPPPYAVPQGQNQAPPHTTPQNQAPPPYIPSQNFTVPPTEQPVSPYSPPPKQATSDTTAHYTNSDFVPPPPPPRNS